jgi:hypothetical protein
MPRLHMECCRCRSTDQVQSGMLEVSGSVFRVRIAWFLCGACLDSGWEIPRHARVGDHELLYFNNRTGERYWQQLPRPIADPLSSGLS